MSKEEKKVNRRDFLFTASYTIGAVGLGAVVWPLVHQMNPSKNSSLPRPINKLCSGQTLLCKSLGLKVTEWNQQSLDSNRIRIEDVGYTPQKIIQTTRLGIPTGRDEHLPYRFIDFDQAPFCTKNPLTMRRPIDYQIIDYS